MVRAWLIVVYKIRKGNFEFMKWYRSPLLQSRISTFTFSALEWSSVSRPAKASNTDGSSKIAAIALIGQVVNKSRVSNS